MQYWAAHHTYMASTADGGIMLDVRRDRFFGLSREQLERLRPAVQGWTAPLVDLTDAQRNAATEAAAALIEKGLLIPLNPPESMLVAVEDIQGAKVRPHHVVRFLQSSAVARISLAGSFSHAIARQQAHQLIEVEPLTPTELERLREATAAFLRLQTFLYTAHLACLYDALAFVEYLYLLRLSAVLVIGIRDDPFVSHAWAQLEDGRVLVGGDPFYLKGYRPITVIKVGRPCIAK